jgi:hypothetical protein
MGGLSNVEPLTLGGLPSNGRQRLSTLELSPAANRTMGCNLGRP